MMRDAKKGTYNGQPTYCPINGYDCPYCDGNCVCHADDPFKDCYDWGIFWSDWDDWEGIDQNSNDAPTDFSKEEIEWAKENLGYEEPEYDIEMGFDPYSGCYTDDC